MTALAILIPAALLLGGIGLAAFLWSLKSGQYDDLDGAALRILDETTEKAPAPERAKPAASQPVSPSAVSPGATGRARG